ncbi:hypothetical protein ACWGF3_24675 [Streptomyces xanthophaeus]|uniref:Uncharacterized protein n=1 Tax=Streptomyces xanthophaeus TaxID=67385 RepID=A0A919LDZ8_9ACTN|nr:hypothetical protein [Streptomyces xanthophaeus]GHI87725.1 hypothetical protein Sxan_50890 [Streptomyces xanthophaeus]
MPTTQPPAPGRRQRSAAGRAWKAFKLCLSTTAFLWVACWLATAMSEQRERCAHQIVGPGGPFRVETSSLPPNETCVWPDGTEIAALDVMTYLWWAAAAATLISFLLAASFSAAPAEDLRYRDAGRSERP